MLRNLVQETCNAPGTAETVTLLGPPAGRIGFVAAFGAGATCFYRLSDGTLEEFGIGTVSAGPPQTLARNTVLWNSAGTTARLNFTGLTRVVNVLPSERAVYVGMANLLATIGAAARGAVGSSALTMDTARLLGRTTAGNGAVEQITVAAPLRFQGGVLDVQPQPSFTELVEVSNGPGNGTLRALGGNSTRPGYVEYRTADGTRRGYHGWKTARDQLVIEAEAGWSWDAPASAVQIGALIGVVGLFAAWAAPPGWLKANGQAVSRTAYPGLWAHAQASANLAATQGGKTPGQYGPGDGSTTFTLPDLRGEFLRVWDDERGVDSGRAVGTSQAQEIQAHTHNYTRSTVLYGAGASNGGRWIDPGPGATPETVAGATTGGAETRPRNIALMACIYAGL